MLNPSELGEQIAIFRKKQNLTQSKLAESLTVSPQAVSNWERGETMPDITKLSELSRILGISIQELLGNESNNPTIEKVNNNLFDENKMYTYLKGYANSRSMSETQKALVYAREKHMNQLRKEGTPYIIHPLTMACYALAMGIIDDNTIATILLHDVCEDCGIDVNELPVNSIVKNGVSAMTFFVQEGETKADAKKRYYDNMISSKEATLTKLIDRCHNVSSMAHVFSKVKLRQYIGETNEYVLPLLRKAKNVYPEMTDILFVLKYHICSVINSIEAVMNLYENEKTINKQ